MWTSPDSFVRLVGVSTPGHAGWGQRQEAEQARQEHQQKQDTLKDSGRLVTADIRVQDLGRDFELERCTDGKAGGQGRSSSWTAPYFLDFSSVTRSTQMLLVSAEPLGMASQPCGMRS